MNKLMGRNCNDKVEPTLNEAVLKYKCTSQDEDGPSVDTFQADFSERLPEKSPWNICLALIFATDYMKQGLSFNQLKDISDYFFRYLQTLQTAHWMMARTGTSRGTAHKESSRQNRIQKWKKSVRLLNPLTYNHTDTLDQILSSLKAS